MYTVQDKLKFSGMRLSHQRMAILVFLKERKEHLSAKDVHESLSREMPSLSRMTVYNTLNALAEKGLIMMMRAPDGTSRYEYKAEGHCHFFCFACERLIDMDFACSHQHTVTLRGHQVHSVQGCFQGICKDCTDSRNGLSLERVASGAEEIKETTGQAKQQESIDQASSEINVTREETTPPNLVTPSEK